MNDLDLGQGSLSSSPTNKTPAPGILYLTIIKFKAIHGSCLNNNIEIQAFNSMYS